MILSHPVPGARVSSSFGVDRGSHAHGGVDFAAGCGTPVYAAASGRVSAANYSASAGNLVHIEHGGGLQTKYFHLQRSVVGVGASVAAGQLIGYVGSTGNSTGCHLHFEVRVNGAAIDPIHALQYGAGSVGAQSGAGDESGSAGAWLPDLSFDSLPNGNDGMMLAGIVLLLVVIVARRL